MSTTSNAIPLLPGEQTVSDIDERRELPTKLLDYFHNNKAELASALGVHRSSIDRRLAGHTQPNVSTLMRMRSLAQERGVS